MDAKPVSFLKPLGYQISSCGYCDGKATSASYYACSREMTVEVYQSLVDRGWRRSGDIFYKPDVARSCCQLHAIRLPVEQFQPSRDQRQTLHRWNRHVLGEQYIREAAKRVPKTKQSKRLDRNAFNLTHSIHEAEKSRLIDGIDPAHHFEVTLESDTFTREKYELYKDYQMNVHKDTAEKASSSGFKNFLCQSPLSRRDIEGQRKLGSYHQCYRLDGRLIAMGVLDLLPHAVSAVYFVYHAEFEKWSFGKLSALREATVALERGYNFYYMGYYVHTCGKMKYKGEYRPQQILEPSTHEWEALDERSNSRLEDDTYKATGDEVDEESFVGPDQATWRHRDVRLAAESAESLLSINMLGICRAAELLTANRPLDQVRIRVRPTTVVCAKDLVSWDDSADELNDYMSGEALKGIVGELIACCGREVIKDVVVDFCPSHLLHD